MSATSGDGFFSCSFIGSSVVDGDEVVASSPIAGVTGSPDGTTVGSADGIVSFSPFVGAVGSPYGATVGEVD